MTKSSEGKKYLAIFSALRPHQWIKNLSLYAAAILNGQLFNQTIFIESTIAFIVFSMLSSSSYLVNDLLDIEKDRFHPFKKNRPLVTGQVTKSEVVFVAFLLFIIGLSLAALVNVPFLIVSIIFVLLQYLYSLILKKKAIVDIISISLFFILRAYAGELATDYHLPIWIMLTVIFLSLFIASGKRRSELFTTGTQARASLKKYSKAMLNFYTTMFAVCTLISYAMFTFLSEPIRIHGRVGIFLLNYFPDALERKWYMITLLPVIFGIMRYGQIIFEMQEGERPESLITNDIPLFLSVMGWGLAMIVIIYAL